MANNHWPYGWYRCILAFNYIIVLYNVWPITSVHSSGAKG